MTFTSKVCTVEKSCQVRRVKAVQDLSLRLGHGAEDSLSGKLSPSSGKGIETVLALTFIARSKFRNTRDDEFLHSNHLSSRQYIDIVRRNYMLITFGK